MKEKEKNVIIVGDSSEQTLATIEKAIADNGNMVLLDAVKYLDGEEEFKRNSQVCVANVDTGEVIRVPRDVAFTKFIVIKESTWLFTTKSVYKQYIQSIMPGSVVPAPEFWFKDKETGESVLKNVYLGYPSMRKSRKGDSKGRGKFTYKIEEIRPKKGEMPKILKWNFHGPKNIGAHHLVGKTLYKVVAKMDYDDKLVENTGK